MNTHLQARTNSPTTLLDNRNGLVIRQLKEWAEIIVNWETRNKYEVLTPENTRIGFVVEGAGSMFNTIKRLIFRSHRPLEISVLNAQSEQVMQLSRKFFFFFSDLNVRDAKGGPMGSIHRRFAILKKKYDLKDERGAVFATIQAPIWRLWTFPIKNYAGQEVGVITKKWHGFLKEVFTDADQFYVDFGKMQWSLNQKAVIFSSAISIDFDFFEDNQGKNDGLLSIG